MEKQETLDKYLSAATRRDDLARLIDVVRRRRRRRRDVGRERRYRRLAGGLHNEQIDDDDDCRLARLPSNYSIWCTLGDGEFESFLRTCCREQFCTTRAVVDQKQNQQKLCDVLRRVTAARSNPSCALAANSVSIIINGIRFSRISR
jgi:hypothetical protein